MTKSAIKIKKMEGKGYGNSAIYSRQLYLMYSKVLSQKEVMIVHNESCLYNSDKIQISGL